MSHAASRVCHKLDRGAQKELFTSRLDTALKAIYQRKGRGDWAPDAQSVVAAVAAGQSSGFVATRLAIPMPQWH